MRKQGTPVEKKKTGRGRQGGGGETLRWPPGNRQLAQGRRQLVVWLDHCVQTTTVYWTGKLSSKVAQVTATPDVLQLTGRGCHRAGLAGKRLPVFRRSIVTWSSASIRLDLGEKALPSF